MLACDGSSFTFTRNQKDIDSYYDPDGRSIRGYNQIHAFNVFAHAIERKSYFLIQAKDVNVHRLLGRDFLSEDSFDLQVERILTRSQSKKKWCHPELEDRYLFNRRNKNALRTPLGNRNFFSRIKTCPWCEKLSCKGT